MCQIVQESLARVAFKEGRQITRRQAEVVGYTGQGQIHVPEVLLKVVQHLRGELGGRRLLVFPDIGTDLADQLSQQSLHLKGVVLQEQLL